MGESKGALAANTSLVVVISGRYARPRSRSVLEDVGSSRETHRSTLDISRSLAGEDGRGQSSRSARSRVPIVECWFNSSGATRRSRAHGRH